MTRLSRDELLDMLQDRILEDFGEPNMDGTWDVYCPHCQAHHALTTLLALYERLDDKDDGPDAEEIAYQLTGPKLH